MKKKPSTTLYSLYKYSGIRQAPGESNTRLASILYTTKSSFCYAITVIIDIKIFRINKCKQLSQTIHEVN